MENNEKRLVEIREEVETGFIVWMEGGVLSTASEEMLDESTGITARAGVATGDSIGTPVETFPDAGEAAPAVFLVCELGLGQFFGLREGPVLLRAGRGAG